MTDLTNWHKEVCKKAGYICQICFRDYDYPNFFLEDGRNAMVCGHHVRSRKAYPELTLDVSNGVCVDLKCHNKIHNGEVKIPELNS